MRKLSQGMAVGKGLADIQMQIVETQFTDSNNKIVAAS